VQLRALFLGIILTSVVGFPFLVHLEAADFGLFDERHDIGITPKAGIAQWFPQTGEYRVSGGGADIRDKQDAFQFVYTQVSGDVALSADVRFAMKAGDPRRKAALMIRQNLDPDSPFADVTLAGDGSTTLEYRPGATVEAEEVRAPIRTPIRLRIERHRHEFDISASTPGQPIVHAGPIVVSMHDPVYIGLAVCSHNPDKLEDAIFSDVQLESKRRGSAR
jgi:TolB protein